jgi:hypothetical protein
MESNRNVGAAGLRLALVAGGKGAWRDNIFVILVEGLWRTIKYEEAWPMEPSCPAHPGLPFLWATMRRVSPSVWSRR